MARSSEKSDTTAARGGQTGVTGGTVINANINILMGGKKHFRQNLEIRKIPPRPSL